MSFEYFQIYVNKENKDDVRRMLDRIEERHQHLYICKCCGAKLPISQHDPPNFCHVCGIALQARRNSPDHIKEQIYVLPTDIDARAIIQVLSLLSPSISKEYGRYLTEQRAEWACHYGWMRVKVLTYSALTHWLITECLHLITAPIRTVLVRMVGLR